MGKCCSLVLQDSDFLLIRSLWHSSQNTGDVQEAYVKKVTRGMERIFVPKECFC